MAKKKLEEEEEEEDEFDVEDEEEFEEEKFICRVCNKPTTLGEGDDMILLCDLCTEKFQINVDKIWDDYDAEKILEENLKKFDLTPYMKKKPGASKKTTGPKK